MLAAPLMIAAFWIPHVTVALVVLFVTFVLVYMSIAPTFSVIQTLAPVRSRALAIAFFLLWQNLVGAGFGPFVLGGMSDLLQQYFDEGEALRIALSSLGVPLAAAAIIILSRCRSVATDLRHSQTANA